MKDLNKTFKAIWNKILENKRITIATHIKPDGDTIGVSIALRELIKINTKDKEVKITGDKYPRFLSFLPKNDKVTDEFFNSSQVIVVDTSTKHRIFDKRVVPEESIKIDHHHKEGKWLMEIGGDYWPATGEILFEMIKSLKLKRNETVDLGIFISIWTDTEGMTQRNITEKTHAALNALDVNQDEIIAKMGLTEEEKKLINTAEIEKIGNVTKSISEVDIPTDIHRQYVNHVFDNSDTEVVLVVINKDDHYRASLRSKGNIDISYYAEKNGGGGHFSSAGFNINNKKNMPEIIDNLIKEINERN